MAFTDEQLKGLNVASQRQILGQATADDLKNLDYATSKGYQFQPTPPAGKVAIPGAQYDTREKQQSAFTGIEPVGNTLYGIPKINTELDVENQSPDVPEPEEVDDISSYMAGIDTTMKGTEAILKKINEPLPQEKEISEIEKEKMRLGEEGAKVQETAISKAEEFGFTENTKNLQSIMSQIAKIKAEFDNAEIAQEGRTTITSMIGGRQALIQRQRAVELAGLSSIAQAYQGNIQLATQTAQQMIDMELAPIQTRIDNQLWQLGQVEGRLTDAQNKKAESLKLVLSERQREVDAEKEKKGKISDLMIVLATNGVSQRELEKVMNTKTYEEAIMMASPYLKDKLSIGDQLKLLEGGYRISPDGSVEVDTSSANANQIANAIKTIESNNNYNAEGASGEFGAYQFMPGTWSSWSKEYAKANNMSLMPKGMEMTPENQDAVAIFKINQWIQQGLTPEQIAAKWNSGSEVGWENKIGVNSQGVAYNVPAYVNKFNSTLGKQLGVSNGEVDAMTQVQAASIVTRISPRLSSNEELISQVAQLIAIGTPMDNIEDELRYLSQSETFEPWRNIANTAFSGVKMTDKLRQNNLDIVDDYIASGDNAGAMEHIKTSILGSVGATEKKQVTGRDDALTSIGVIEDLLEEYTSQGGNTGLLTGKVEDFRKKVLKKTKNEELAYLANEITTAIQKYRQDLTGAAFTESEAKEYASIFPSVGKSPTLNKGLIDSLKAQYERNLRKFWERQLGGAVNYNKLQDLAGTPIVGMGDLDRFNPSSPEPITNNYLTNLGY